MTKKLAVVPIHPDAIPMPAVVVPASWEDAFAMMSDRMARVVGRQAAEIKGLKDDLADARGVIAAGAKTVTDLTVTIAGLAAALEVQDTATKAQGHHGVDLVATVDEIRGRTDELVQSVERMVMRADEIAGNVVAAGVRDQAQSERIDALAAVVDMRGVDAREQATRVERLAEAIEAAGVRGGDLIQEFANEAAARADSIVGKLTALVEDYAETASGEDAALTARLDEVVRIADIAASVTEALSHEFQVAGVAGRELSVRVDEVRGRTDGLVQTVDQMTAQADQLLGAVKAATTIAEDAAGRVDEVADLVDKQTGELRAAIKDQGEQGVRVGAVEETVIGFVSSAAALAREIRTIDEGFKTGVAAIAAVEDQSRDALRRVTIALDQMPAGFMIDQVGVLNRVNRAGDMTPLGTVVGRAKDGTSPAQIVATRIENDRFVMTLSDRSEIGCAMPRAVEVVREPDPTEPTELGYLSKDVKIRAVQVEDMTRMRAAKKNFKEIAAKYAISERQAARLIKGFNDEKPSDR
jgi:hypothetical protein